MKAGTSAQTIFLEVEEQTRIIFLKYITEFESYSNLYDPSLEI